MATKKKGCGFLITAIVLLIAAAAIFGIGVVGAFKSMAPVTSFDTPNAGAISSGEDGAISVWLHGNDTSVPSGVSINVREVESGQMIPAPLTSLNSHIEVNGDRRILLGAFEGKNGKDYQVQVDGLSAGRKISLSNTSGTAVAGSIGAAIVGPMICGGLALIFGIIGLVKFFGSKTPPAQSPPVATPGAPPAM
ncbi:MAG: hypothetical protein H7A51_00525 [Akkermansiaceae bacterium]|nr:hypothetical protein [Akkermansiaceae bacterium]